MKQATFALACVILWSLQPAACEAQEEASAAKNAPRIKEAKPVAEPDAEIKPVAEPDPPQATVPGPAAEPAVEPAVDATEAFEAMRKTIARLQAEKKEPMIDDICEVKHYKRGNLHGFGLVLDLEALVASRTEEAEEAEEEIEGVEEVEAGADVQDLVEMLKLLNQSMTEETAQKPIMDKLRGTEHLTVVAVSADIPPEGVRQGERIDCQVKSIEGTSLDNGYLLPTRLSTQSVGQEVNAGIAAGRLERDTSGTSGARKVVGGCLVKTDISDQFTQNNTITLVLDEDHAEFATAQEVVDLINVEMGSAEPPVAKALNRHSIEVSIPPQYQEDPVAFITRILRLPSPEALADALEE